MDKYPEPVSAAITLLMEAKRILNDYGNRAKSLQDAAGHYHAANVQRLVDELEYDTKIIS